MVYYYGLMERSQRDALYRSFNIISRYLLTIQLAEAIKVDVEFKNPLQITISISSVSLICELSASSEEMDCGKFVPVPVQIFFSVFPLFFLVSEIGKFCHQRELTSVSMWQMLIAQPLSFRMMRNLEN